MIKEWQIFEPAKDNWPDLWWATALDEPDADYLMALHRQLYPGTVFKVREVAFT